MKRLAAALVLVAGLGVLGMSGAEAGHNCPPVIGCTSMPEQFDVVPGICIKPGNPTNTECPPLGPGEEEPDGSLLCVGGDNQRKPGSYQGVCIGDPF